MENFIESNNPEIDVNEVMAKIKEEARKAESKQTVHQDHVSSHAEFINFDTITSQIIWAETNADAGSQVSPMDQFTGIKRKVAIILGRIIVFVLKFITDKQRAFNRAVIAVLNELTEALRQIDVKIKPIADHINDSVSKLENNQIQVQESIRQVREEQKQIKQEQKQCLESFKSNELANTIRNLEKQIVTLKARVSITEGRLNTYIDYERRSAAGHSTDAQPSPLSKALPTALIAQQKKVMDQLYVSFENHFRGSSEEIKDRLRFYLRFVKEAAAGSPDRPILDVGCGRGDWLELLEEEGLTAKGVDSNTVLIEECQGRQLDAICGDAIEYLRTLPQSSLGGVTAFHIVEHLPLESIIDLLNETVRALKPGGLAIFETPNPQNYSVGSCYFYTDPTHRNPIPHWTLSFLIEDRGLCRPEVLALHPMLPESIRLGSLETSNPLNEVLYGPQDYAIVAYKA